MRPLNLKPLVCALAVVLAPWNTLAADAHASAASGHADHAESAAPPAKTAPVAAAKAAAATARPAATSEDPLDVVRQRLAERLAARRATEPGSQNLVRVATRSEPEAASPVRRTLKVTEPAHDHAEPAAGGGDKLVEGREVHWAYAGSTGPETWAQLKPEFATCAIGRRQSPIDIRDGFKVQLEAVKFDYRNSGFRVIDNGHTVQVNVSGGNTISVSGQRFELVQFHFHRPSEERIDGRTFDMVVHLVHKDYDGKLAVVAVLLDRGSAQPIIQTVWNNLPLEKNVEQAGNGGLDLNALLPTDRSYFTYMGSLTTPPCSEGVLWMVMKQPVQISSEQLEIFARLYPMNARPVQRTAGRVIKESQ